jgi:hypothetical protein
LECSAQLALLANGYDAFDDVGNDVVYEKYGYVFGYVVLFLI